MKNFSLIILANLVFTLNSIAQSPTDALMMEKNQLCIAATWQNDSWKEYWEGTLLRDNQNIGTLTRNVITPMLGYGFSQKLNLMIGLPYVTTKSSGGQLQGVSGFQDLSFFVKARLVEMKKSNNEFNLFTTAGISFPASNYHSDYLPYALGLGTTEYSIRGILKYQYKSKTYARAGFGYYHRTETEIERDFHYNNGPVYSNLMDVPSVTQYELAIGQWILKTKLQLELTLNNQTGLSGDDIRRQNSPQPTNKMNFTNGNFYVRYFPEFINGFSVFGSYYKTFAGRNVGQSQGLIAGFTYFIKTNCKSTSNKL